MLLKERRSGKHGNVIIEKGVSFREKGKYQEPQKSRFECTLVVGCCLQLDGETVTVGILTMFGCRPPGPFVMPSIDRYMPGSPRSIFSCREFGQSFPLSVRQASWFCTTYKQLCRSFQGIRPRCWHQSGGRSPTDRNWERYKPTGEGQMPVSS